MIKKEKICTGYNERCKQGQIKYIQACEKLGDYYFKIKKYRSALKYYLTVADLGVYTNAVSCQV
jgi:hypothetical protein